MHALLCANLNFAYEHTTACVSKYLLARSQSHSCVSPSHDCADVVPRYMYVMGIGRPCYSAQGATVEEGTGGKVGAGWVVVCGWWVVACG